VSKKLLASGIEDEDEKEDEDERECITA